MYHFIYTLAQADFMYLKRNYFNMINLLKQVEITSIYEKQL